MLPNLEEIYKVSFGLWINGLFSAISGHNRGVSFQQHKQYFFNILRLWLDEKKIVFCTPSDPLGIV